MTSFTKHAHPQQDVCNNRQHRASQSRALLSPEEASLFAQHPHARYLFKWEVINPKTDYFSFEVVTRAGGRLTGNTWDIVGYLEHFSVGGVTARWSKATRRMALRYPTRIVVDAPDLIHAPSGFCEWSQRHA
jgi:hypothetical protein